jgi:nucleotide-binding universal stress UspA family protein
MITIQKILIPVDFSESAMFTARYAATMAQAHQAQLYVLHIKAPYPVHGRIAAGALEHVQNRRIKKEQMALAELIPDRIKDSIVVKEIQVTGTPMARVIVEKARELSVDVIVMPAQSRKHWLRIFKENVMHRVIQDAPCSVFAVRCPQSQSDTSNP